MRRFASILFVAALGIPCVALADDLNPPNQPVPLPGNILWARGALYSTSAEWEFLTNANPITPDGTVPVYVGNFPINGPLATMTNLTYSNDGQGMDGWLAGTEAGSIILDIPNWIDNEEFKYLHLQISYNHPGPDSTMSVNIQAFDGHGVQEVHFEGAIDGHFLPNDEHYLYQFWQIIPNPDWERITIDVPAGYFIDEIVVDTISIPEPATMGLLAVGGAVVGLIRRRRS